MNLCEQDFIDGVSTCFQPIAQRGRVLRISLVIFDEIRVKLPLTWQTRNYVGTIFGGSMYAAVDPVYMLMLIKNLGPDYIVWDKSACIKFKKPGRTTLFARFVLNEKDIEAIRRALVDNRSVDRTYQVELTDEEGIVHASVEKVIYIRLKERNV